MNLTGKTALILGVADESSIAWSIAKGYLDHGATVYIGYQQKFFSRVRLLLQAHPMVDGARCDVLDDAELSAFFDRFKATPIDVLVHCIAFGPPEVFTQPPSQIKNEAFLQTLSISTHSFLKIVGSAAPFMREWGSIMTLTYQASEQASPFYGMMGVAKAALESCVRYLAIEMGQRNVRVNAISPGPIETPAALGEMLAFLRNPEAMDAPSGAVLKGALYRINQDPALRAEDDQVKAKALWHAVQQRVAGECAISEVVTQDDVAGCAAFLASDYSRKITGQVLRIDCGMSSSRLMPTTDIPPSVAQVTDERTIEVMPTLGNISDVTPGLYAEQGEAAVMTYLRSEFPEAEVRLNVKEDDGSALYTAATATGLLTFRVDQQLLSRSADEIDSCLRNWQAAVVMREASGLVVHATIAGLTLGDHGGDP